MYDSVPTLSVSAVAAELSVSAQCIHCIDFVYKKKKILVLIRVTNLDSESNPGSPQTPRLYSIRWQAIPPLRRPDTILRSRSRPTCSAADAERPSHG
jgi:hypothetical protein